MLKGLLMKIRKGKNTFKEYQQRNQDRRRSWLSEELLKLQTDKAQFKTLTHLARRAADMLHQRELLAHSLGKLEHQPARVSPSTLLRNDIYRVLLLSFQAGNLEAPGTSEIRSADIVSVRKNNPAVNVYLGDKELQIARLEEQLKNVQLAMQKKHDIDSEGINKGTAVSDELQVTRDNHDRTLTALYRLISKIEFLDLDYVGERVIDRSRFDEEIVDKRLLKPFFNYLKMNNKMLGK